MNQNPHSNIPIIAFFREVFMQIHVRGRRRAYIEQFVTAIGWLRSLLGCEPTLGDFTPERMQLFVGRLANCGMARNTTANIRTRLWALWRSAYEMEWACPPVSIDQRRSVPKYCHHRESGQAYVRLDGKKTYLGKHGSPESREKYWKLIAGFRLPPTLALPPEASRPERAWNLAPPPPGSLLNFYRTTFRPSLALSIRGKELQKYDGAITHYCDFTRTADPPPLTLANRSAFRRYLERMGLDIAATYARCLQRIDRAHQQSRESPSRYEAPPDDPQSLPADKGEWTLAQFFEAWVAPAVLRSAHCIAATEDTYRDALRYWKALTDNPPLAHITDETCIGFVHAMGSVGICRLGIHHGERPLIVPDASLVDGARPLSSATIAGHVSSLARLLLLAGPRTNPRQPAARIIAEVPYFPKVASRYADKPAFSLDTCRRIAAACDQVDGPKDLPSWFDPALWFRLRVALLFYTGMRIGTIRRLTWGHVIERKEGLWLSVPGTIVKTGKPIQLRLHQQAADLVQRLSRGDDDDLLAPGMAKRDSFRHFHKKLQQSAGLQPEEWISVHGWRRTHGRQIALLGADLGTEAARGVLGHAHANTTKAHYLAGELLDVLRMKLPLLWPDEGEAAAVKGGPTP